MKQRPYPGDSPGKQRARTLLYNAISSQWKSTPRPLGAAVVLAGDEACEAEELARLCFLPSECLFVDHGYRCGLRAAQSALPGVRTFFGDIRTALRMSDRIALLHLDLMGQPNALAGEALSVAGERMVTGSIVAFTFVRAHETYRTRTGAQMLEASGSPDRLTPEMRWKYVRNFLPASLGCSVEIFFEIDYFSRLGMSCVAAVVA